MARAGNNSSKKQQAASMRTRIDGVDSPASDPVLVWRPTLWSVEYRTPAALLPSPEQAHAHDSQPLIGSGQAWRKGQLPLPQSPTRVFPTTDRNAFPRMSNSGSSCLPMQKMQLLFSECMSALRCNAWAPKDGAGSGSIGSNCCRGLAVSGSTRMRAVSRAYPIVGTSPLVVVSASALSSVCLPACPQQSSSGGGTARLCDDGFDSSQAATVGRRSSVESAALGRPFIGRGK
ncbi:hypothetical protein TgHK011_002282 [Trichoderma gracile]|nr:hypothetical protein TgHK011_002282 [Trichoderma gracile]